MPRGSRRSSGRTSPSFGRGPAPSPRPTVPAQRPPTSVGQPATQRQPGLFAQMASTAAGVAIGSTVGHTVSGALLGGQNSEQQAVDQQQTAAPAPGYQQPYQQQLNNPCQEEMRRFVECAQGQADITLCQGFNEALRQCKLSYGLS